MNLLSQIMVGLSYLLKTSFADGSKWAWVNDLTGAVEGVIAPILGVIASAGCVYAIVLGVQMARADTADKREEAKKRMIGIIIAIVVMIALILFFTLLFDDILQAMLPNDLPGKEDIKTN